MVGLVLYLSCIATQRPADREWTLALAGDVMLNGIPANSRPLAEVAPSLRSADWTIVNLEIPMASTGRPTSAKSRAARRAKTQFILRADPAHVDDLASCGIDAVSLGNNHAMDYGALGLSQMTQRLQARSIRFAGAGPNKDLASRPAQLERSGLPCIRILSFLAFRSGKAIRACTPAGRHTPGVNALAAANVDVAAKARIALAVQEARIGADFVIVALHWGTERTAKPNAYQVTLGRAFIDAGADLVVGHHPHVLQGAEIYRGKPILYSLGNLVSPKPGSTALFHLTYEGTRFVGLGLRPCRIAGGKVKQLPEKKRSAALKAWRGLCQAIAKSFPNKLSSLPEPPRTP